MTVLVKLSREGNDVWGKTTLGLGSGSCLYMAKKKKNNNKTNNPPHTQLDRHIISYIALLTKSKDKRKRHKGKERNHIPQDGI